MDTFLDIIKYSVSGLLVLGCTYFVLRTLLANDEKRMRHERILESSKMLTPVKLTAYERLSIFLERIKPESMVLRIQTPLMTASDLHLAILTQVREEYEHNVSQQIYVSEDVWRFVSTAKESLIQFVNTCAVNMPQGVPAIELSKVLIENYNNANNETPIDIALSVIKAEVKSLG